MNPVREKLMDIPSAGDAGKVCEAGKTIMLRKPLKNAKVEGRATNAPTRKAKSRRRSFASTGVGVVPPWLPTALGLELAFQEPFARRVLGDDGQLRLCVRALCQQCRQLVGRYSAGAIQPWKKC